MIVDAHNRIVATGYNGPPANMQVYVARQATCHSDCPRAQEGAVHSVNDYSNCISIHAEANALLFCDRREREGGTLIMWPGLPCYECAKLIANSGLSRVVATTTLDRDGHRASKALELWRDCGITFVDWSRPLGH